MEDVHATVEIEGFVRAGGEGGYGCDDVGVAKKHEDVPDTELCWEWDGVVENGKVPASSVRGGSDTKLSL